MGWWQQLFGMQAARPASDDDFWYRPVAAATSGGMRVNAASATRASAVYACVVLLSDTVGSLPLHIFERTTNGKRRAENHPLADILQHQPNVWQSSQEFRTMMQTHALLRGNAIARRLSGPRGAVDQLVPLNPDHVQIDQLESGRLVYRYTPSGDAQAVTLSQDEVFHLRAPLLDATGVLGVSPIDHAADVVGGMLAAQAYGNRFFANDARSSVYIKHPGHLKNTEALAKTWERAHGGDNQHRVAILEEGMEVGQLSVTPEQAQFLETRKFLVGDIARIFRVPPHMIGDHEKGASFASVEQQSLDFVTHSIRPWLTRWEEAIRRDLIINPDRFFAEHVVEGLLRGDIKARYEAYAIGRQWGWLSVNDIRKKENLNPVEDGDAYLVPLNMVPAGEARRSDGRGIILGTPQSLDSTHTKCVVH